MSKKQFYLLQAPIETRGTPWESWHDRTFALLVHATSEMDARAIAMRDEVYTDWFRDDVRVTILDESYSGEDIVIEDVYR